MIKLPEWQHPNHRPSTHGMQALLSLHVEPDNTGASMEEFWRLAWWDDHNKRWQMIDADNWFIGSTLKPGDDPLRAWLELPVGFAWTYLGFK